MGTHNTMIDMEELLSEPMDWFPGGLWHHRFIAGGVHALFPALNGTMIHNKSKRGTGPIEANWSRIPKYTECIAICFNIFVFSYPSIIPK